MNKPGKDLDDHLIALKATRLREGMYVAALDRLWLHTPFPPNGFYIRNEEQIQSLKRYCTYVYIDPLRSEDPQDVVVPFEPMFTSALTPRLNQHEVNEELEWARQAYAAMLQTVRHMIRDVRVGSLPDISELNKGIGPMVSSIQRCPDALLWLIRTEKPTGYLYRRAIGTAVTATAFGHRLGFEREDLMELALGGLLLDIGKIEVPVTLLAKPELLTPTEHGVVRKHVSHAVGMVKVMENVPMRVLEMVSSHHERFDGSGYPKKQRGTEIPLFARIAGIVDTYDAITLDRRYAPAISGHTALRYLNSQRRSKFDGALLQEFIHAMGIYPTGSWVELLDGSVGVVCSQDARWPLSPRVVVVRDASGNKISPKVVPTTRANPIINARHTSEVDLLTPDLDAIA
ncbi:MAG: HD-GYP domain-containing protein [Gammaproteobacteria bacterium]